MVAQALTLVSGSALFLALIAGGTDCGSAADPRVSSDASGPMVANVAYPGDPAQTTRSGAYGNKNIVETAVEAGMFSTLATALTEAELVEALEGEGPFTVFAPTDDAFAALPEGVLEDLLKEENRDKLIAVLKYHVVAGRVPARDVVELEFAPTLSGQRIDVAADRNGVTVDRARVIRADVMASNGVIHVIDTVLLPELRTIPEVAAEVGSFQTLLAAAEAAGMVEALSGEGPLTVFAPTDDAFGALPPGTVEGLLLPENLAKLREILGYHVVSGRVYSDEAVEAGRATTLIDRDVTIRSRYGSVRVQGARVIDADIEAFNGVIHVIDSVILPE